MKIITISTTHIYEFIVMPKKLKVYIRKLSNINVKRHN